MDQPSCSSSRSMVVSASSSALRRWGLEVRSDRPRSRCISRDCKRRLRSASSRLASGVTSEVESFGVAASACCSSTLLDSQPFDINLSYARGRGRGLDFRPLKLLPAKTIENAEVEAKIVLNRAACWSHEVGPYPGWSKPQREIGIEVVVGVHRQR